MIMFSTRRQKQDNSKVKLLVVHFISKQHVHHYNTHFCNFLNYYFKQNQISFLIYEYKYFKLRILFNFD